MSAVQPTTLTTRATRRRNGRPVFAVPWTQNPPLCAICRVIVLPNKTFTHSEQYLKISAARGCGLCDFLFTQIVLSGVRLPTRLPSDLQIERREDMVYVFDHNRRRHRFEICSSSGSDSQMRSARVYRQIQKHPDLAPCWELVNKWIADCKDNHKACRQNLDVAKPSRLIDVQFMRLVDGSNCASNDPYVTLSHCWGPGTFTRTTIETLSEFQRSIKLDSLPKNFQDAIRVTSKLGIRYLWIDALCIIQDDLDDWKIESAKMGLYYRNAFVSISALSGEGADSGFFNDREEQMTLELGESQHLRRVRPPWSEVSGNAALTSRAWVLQERLLSTRIIHFEKEELFWECSTTFAREGSYEENSRPWQGDMWTEENFKRCLVFESTNAQDGDQRLNIDLFMAQWDRILCLYSTLNLTKMTDTFPAISGIAQKIHEATGYTYIAGLWKEHLHAGLLWHTDRFEFREHRKEENQAPSWSWASLEKPIKMIYDCRSCVVPSPYDAEVLDASIQLPSASEMFIYGANASLKLHAYTFRVWCRSVSVGQAGYADPNLQMVLDIFDGEGVFVGTGFWDRYPKETVSQCKAVFISQRLDKSLGDTPIMYFLLVKEWDEFVERIGVGQTADEMRGVVGKGIDFGTCVRETVLLR